MHPEVLRPETLTLARTLGTAEELQGLTLMGGTALAMQIGHRVSLDLDFACFEEPLPSQAIEQCMARLKEQGHTVQLITSSHQISTFKINTGRNLLDLVRDYVVDGVKVTFFVHGRNEPQRDFYRQTATVTDETTGLTLLGLEGLRVAKTLVLADRVRSRDLYDLHILMRDHGYSLDELFDTVRRLGTVDDPEYYKAVLRGEIPLDDDDEGLEPVQPDAGINAVHAFFNELLDDWETRRARDFFSGKREPPK